VDGHAAHLEVTSRQHGEAFPLEQAAGEFTRFHMKPAWSAARCGIRDEAVQDGAGHALSGRIGPAVEVVDVAVRLQVAVADDVPSRVRCDEREPPIGGAGVNHGGICRRRRPRLDLLLRVSARTQLPRRLEVQPRHLRGIAWLVAADGERERRFAHGRLVP